MSALVGFIQRDRAHLVTDGAAYLANGTVTTFGSKVLPIAHLDMAIAARGATWPLPALAVGISQAFRTFDEAADGLADFVRELLTRHESMLAVSAAGTCYELAAAGMAKGGPQILVVKSYGPDAWELQRLAAYLAPCDDALISQLGGLGAHPERLAEADPEAAARSIVRAQRGRTWSGPAGEVQAIGGFCQLTTVVLGEITSRIVERWPDDEVGRKIGRLEDAPSVAA